MFLLPGEGLSGDSTTGRPPFSEVGRDLTGPVLSYKDTLTINFIRNTRYGELEYHFHRVLQQLGLTVTFSGIRFIGWSVYPMAAFFLLGGFLIFLGICRPAREMMERKFFF